MRHLLLAALFAAAISRSLTAETNIPFPPTSPPAGTNPATFAAPRLDGWLSNFLGRLQKSHAAGAKVDIVFDGDSITDFWQGNGKNLWANYEKLNAFDFAIAGDRTQHVLWRLQQGQVDNLHPKLVFLMIGTNNVPGPDTPEQIAEGVRAIVDDYRKRCPDAVIVLQAIFPRGATANPMRDKIKAVNVIISKYGDGQHVIYLDFADKFLAPDGSLGADIMPDFLHPSLKGYQIWADQINPVINKYLPDAKLPLSSGTPAP